MLVFLVYAIQKQPYKNIHKMLQGLNISVTGPTLMDLSDIIQNDLPSTSFVFISKYLVGSIIGSFTGTVIPNGIENVQ